MPIEITSHLEKFDEWNAEKKYLHKSTEVSNIFINPGEIWYIKMGINIGFEQNGKKEFRRPVLVLKKIGNMFFCVPLTTKGKENNPFYHKISIFGKEGTSYIITSQGRTFDKKRFMDSIGSTTKGEFETIKKSLREVYF